MAQSPSGRHLVIREEQIAAFAAEAIEVLIDRGVAQVEKSHPALATKLGPEETRAFVRRVVAATDRHGFDLESQVLRFLDLTSTFGEGFERSARHPWAGRALADTSLTAGQRLDLLQSEAALELHRRAQLDD